jgi:hypothetical protein
MTDKKPDLTKLPLMTFQEIPEPKADAGTITALVKEGGRITGYQLSDGRVLSKEEGVQLAKQGGIRDVGVATRDVTEYLKSLPDDSEQNNLGSLPSVKK